MADAPDASDPLDEALEQAVRTHDEALAEQSAGRLTSAERLGRAAIADLERLLPPDHPDVANARDTLAGILAGQGRFLEARPLWEGALAAFDVYRDEEEVALMRLPVLRAYAAALVQATRYDEARPLIDLAIAEARRLPAAGQAAVAEGHNLLAVWHRMQGGLAEAEALYLRAAADLADSDGGLPPELLHNLAGLATARGEHRSAEELLRRALEARGARPGADPVGLAADLAGLGDALLGLGRTSEAIARHREALAVLREAGLQGHPEVAFCLHNLGDALAARGEGADAVEAEACYRESVAGKERCFGAEHAELAASLANLAGLLDDLGRGAEGRPLLRRAREIAERLGEGHPVRGGILALARRLDAG